MSAGIDYRKVFNDRARAARERMLAAAVKRKPVVRDILLVASRDTRLEAVHIYSAPIGPCIPRPTAHQIIQAFCYLNGISRAELISPRRDADTVRLRRELAWKLRQETTLSLPQIGKLLHRDHTSILAGLRAYEKGLNAKRRHDEARAFVMLALQEAGL